MSSTRAYLTTAAIVATELAWSLLIVWGATLTRGS